MADRTAFLAKFEQLIEFSKVQDLESHTVAEGNGPVNALNKALRYALNRDFPHLQNVHLSDFKVRILDSDAGTAATTRVLIDFHDGHNNWTTVGASSNIIEASW
ncbi:MAG: citramalate synthase, partial [Chloroflexia bacterium]|nr:citramalate synthase [Chloroflexia bacterium]